MAKRQEIIIPYNPRAQMVSYHERAQRWAIIVAHRRFGKTVGCVNDLIKPAIICNKRESRFAYVAPTYAQAKDVAWGYLKYYAGFIPRITINESELYVQFAHNGARIRLYGSDNYDRMRGIYLDGVVNDEYGDQDPRAWTEVIRPALSDRKGWATFIGTPRGQNHFKDLWDKAQSDDAWYKLILKASQTNLIDADELRDARLHMSMEQYAAEYECSFAGSLSGAYYAKYIGDLEDDGRLRGDWWRPDAAVHTAWDVGKTTAVWYCQVVDGRVLIIDFDEAVGQSAAWWADRLRSKKYKYGQHIVPSDADDIKELAGFSWCDGLARMGLSHFHVLPKQTNVDMGIEAVRNLLPRCYFSDLAKEGVKALINYHTKWDDKRKTFKNHPEHDWSSHAADAMRYLALGLDHVSNKSATIKSMQKRPSTSFMGI